MGTRALTRQIAAPRWLVLSIAVAGLWGVWGALIEIPERHFSPGFPSTLGYVVWSLTMLPCALLALARSRWRVDCSPAALAYGAGVGLLGAGGQLILFRTLERGPAYLVFPIISLSPLVTIVLSFLILRERAHRTAAAGVALALAAMLLLSIQPASGGTVQGSAWLAGALGVYFMWGVQAYFWKSSAQAIRAESMFLYMAITALMLAPLAWRMTDFDAPINWSPTGPWLTALIQAPNALGALLIIYAFRAGKAIVVSPMINGLAPVITIVLSLVIYHRLPGFWNGAGMIAAIAAILLMSYGEAR